MTPEDIVRRMTYDPTGTDPFPEPSRPPADRLGAWLSVAVWIAAALVFGALLGWWLP